jgi:hypothetical protein
MVYKCDVSRQQAKRINDAIRPIDPSMSFTRHYAAGNDAHGWLSRPNDGTNDYNHVRDRSQRCIDIADRVLAVRVAA